VEYWQSPKFKKNIQQLTVVLTVWRYRHYSRRKRVQCYS